MERERERDGERERWRERERGREIEIDNKGERGVLGIKREKRIRDRERREGV